MARKQKTGLAPEERQEMWFTTFSWTPAQSAVGKFDFKFFFEVRPGLIGWVMINFFLYVADCLCYESSILSTMDIIEEGFGFMLAFGDISWVPVMYSLQARYLVDNPVKLSWTTTTAIVALFGHV
ncbi:hypothetical protein OS493_007298 [Desmophyllum pertusum]|uniref:Uncharacterized protein n=1 Tax=Desmophyllum pertusum TaxID=174260 RepID=A0A9W9Z4H2_9CNID|nr:hypothetical protein OS493_007298 [Desmophyllum pertusum]